MPQVTGAGTYARCTLFPKVGLPSNACANLCGARWRVGARRNGAVAAVERAAAIDFHRFTVSRVFGVPVVPPDVAGVVRLHFGALSPARRAPEVRLDVSLLHQIHSDNCAGAS